MPANSTPASGSIQVMLPPEPVWHYTRQVVTGTTDVPVLDKNGSPLPASTFIVFQAISDNGTGDARIKFNPADPVTNAVIVSGVSASSHQGLEWGDASTSNGRAVFVFKYRLP